MISCIMIVCQKESEKEAVAPNTKISRFKIEGIMPLVETQKARYWY